MRVAALLTLCSLLAAPAVAAKPKVTLDIDAEVVPGEVAAGGRGEIRVTLGLPPGIVLNRFPGITFTPAAVSGVAFDEEKTFVGEKKPVKDPDDFYFEELDPLVVGFSVGHEERGTKTVSGELKYFYCVKKSGYCAPGKQTVTARVTVR